MNRKEKHSDKDKFISFFIKKRKYFVLNISLFYPLSHRIIVNYWDYLYKGDAHYSFVGYGDFVEEPQFGLCFNNNIKWTGSLLSKWPTMRSSVPPDDEDSTVYASKPLSIKKEIELREGAWIESTLSDGEGIDDGFNEFFVFCEESMKHYDTLSFDEFKNLFNANSYAIVLNQSIWDNTISEYLNDHNIIDIILPAFKRGDWIIKKDKGPWNEKDKEPCYEFIGYFANEDGKILISHTADVRDPNYKSSNKISSGAGILKAEKELIKRIKKEIGKI